MLKKVSSLNLPEKMFQEKNTTKGTLNFWKLRQFFTLSWDLIFLVWQSAITYWNRILRLTWKTYFCNEISDDYA